MKILPKTILLIAAPFVLLPLVWIFSTAFRTDAGLFTIKTTGAISELTINNFITLFNDYAFGRWLFNSISLALVSSIIATTAGFAFAFELLFTSSKIFLKFRGLVLLSYLIPSMFLIFSLQILYHPHRDSLDLIVLIFAYQLFLLPIAVWLGSGYISRIPYGVVILSKNDGIGYFERLKYLLIPFASRGFLSTFALCFVIAFQEYIYGLILLSDDYTLTVTTGVVKLQAGDVYEWGVISSAAVVVCLFCGIVVWVAASGLIGAFQRLLRVD